MLMKKPQHKRIILIREIKRMVIKSGLTQDEIANIIGWEQENVSRALSGKQNLTIDKLIELLEAVNIELTLKNK